MKQLNTEVPSELKTAIKVLAAQKETTFKKIVIEALQEKLERESLAWNYGHTKKN